MTATNPAPAARARLERRDSTDPRRGTDRRHRLARRVGAPLLAIGLGLALSACGAMGPGTSSPTETAAESAPVSTAGSTGDATGGATGDAANECADVEQTLANLETRLTGLGEKIPGDIPGAITDIQTSVEELTTLRDSLGEGEVKTHVTNIITLGEEAIGILEQAQSGDISPIEAISQGTGKIAEVQEELEALNDYCAGV